ncbi:MAG: protein kinase [Acidobacteria bacterium]|jgi:serine/threonine-protein kinase|nr:protein kinase [Acidobacteriota bacterium]
MFLKDQLIGKYRVQKALGNGGFGAVYLAEDTMIGKLVALKVPHKQNQDQSELAAEAKLMAPLSHPNIVSVLTADQDNESGVFFIVMEYVEGESLADLLTREGNISEAQAVTWAMQVCSAVAYAHKHNVIHRDLRPSNVLLTKDKIAKVVDFSISRLLEKESYASTKIGSPPYMAPEHFQGRATYASDIYSMGVMMYEMVTGVLPFFDLNPSRIEEMVALGRFTPPNLKNRSVSKELSDIIVKAMARDLSQRYHAADELLSELKHLRATPQKQRELNDIRARIAARETPKESFCFNCRRPLPKRAITCPFCGQKQ